MYLFRHADIKDTDIQCGSTCFLNLLRCIDPQQISSILEQINHLAHSIRQGQNDGFGLGLSFRVILGKAQSIFLTDFLDKSVE